MQLRKLALKLGQAKGVKVMQIRETPFEYSLQLEEAKADVTIMSSFF